MTEIDGRESAAVGFISKRVLARRHDSRRFLPRVTIVPRFSPNQTLYIHSEAPGAQLRSAESATRQKIPLKIRGNDRNYRPPIIA
jgi:hypothetical protein